MLCCIMVILELIYLIRVLKKVWTILQKRSIWNLCLPQYVKETKMPCKTISAPLLCRRHHRDHHLLLQFILLLRLLFRLISLPCYWYYHRHHCICFKRQINNKLNSIEYIILLTCMFFFISHQSFKSVWVRAVNVFNRFVIFSSMHWLFFEQPCQMTKTKKMPYYLSDLFKVKSKYP